MGKAGASVLATPKSGKPTSLETYRLDENEEDRVRQALAPLLVSLKLSVVGEIRLGRDPKTGEMTLSGAAVTHLPVTAAY